MSWRPLLEGADAEAARAAIAAIADDLATHDFHEPSLIHGAAGAALVHGTLARGGHPDGAERAHAALARALELFAAAPPSPWLGTGLAGIAWVMHHLADVVDTDADTLAQIDALIERMLSRDPWSFDYELWHGVVGLGVYALSRGRLDLVTRVVEHLTQLAEISASGATWWNWGEPGLGDGSDHHDLGMAHGVTGAIVMLADAHEAGIAHAAPLLASAVQWLCAWDRAATMPRFPMHVGIDVPAAATRNGWCHGDAAIATMLVRAAAALDQPTLEIRAVELARSMAQAPIDHAPDFDAAFCHGAAGRAHMLNRLAQATGDAALFDAARRYHGETLARLAGWDAPKPCLATGTSGIALALHAAISTAEPGWDRLFLVTLPTR